jgi:uncharacterized protein YdeI (YjbR/CyaY-like superfamily)
MGGCHMMPVNRTLREAAGVKPGDIVVVVMQRDHEVRTVAAPAVLNKALAKNKAAKGTWEKLAFTHQKEMAVWIEGAKQEETRVRRLAKVMQVLQSGTKWTG